MDVQHSLEARREEPLKRPALDFVVGQDPRGRWLAVEAHGLAGGIFVSREAAIRYVAAECNTRCDAVRLASRALAPLRP